MSRGVSSMSVGETDSVVVYQPLETVNSLGTEEIAEKHIELDALPRSIAITGLNGVAEFHQNLEFSQESTKLDLIEPKTSKELQGKLNSDALEGSPNLNSLKCNMNLELDSFGGLVNMDNNMIVWQDGIGFIPGSELRFHVNEFGLIEILDDEAWQRFYDQSEAVTQVVDSNSIGEGSVNCKIRHGKTETSVGEQAAVLQDVITLQSACMDETIDAKSNVEGFGDKVSDESSTKTRIKVLEIESDSLGVVGSCWKNFIKSTDANVSAKDRTPTFQMNIDFDIKQEDVSNPAVINTEQPMILDPSARMFKIENKTMDVTQAPASNIGSVEGSRIAENNVVDIKPKTSEVHNNNENSDNRVASKIVKQLLNGVDGKSANESMSVCSASGDYENNTAENIVKHGDFQSFRQNRVIEGLAPANEIKENSHFKNACKIKPKDEDISETRNEKSSVPIAALSVETGNNGSTEIMDSRNCGNALPKQTFVNETKAYMKFDSIESDEAESSSGLPEEELPDIEPLPLVGLPRIYTRSRSRSLSPVFHLQPPPPLENKLYVDPNQNPDGFPVLKAETASSEDQDIAFCRCCGCFGLPQEFYKAVYCTKACGDSYKYHLTSPDGKFKKPSSTTPKKPKLAVCGDGINAKSGEFNAYSRPSSSDQGFSSDMGSTSKLLKKKSKGTSLKKNKTKQNGTSKLLLKPVDEKTEGGSTKKSRKVGGTKSTAFHSKDRKRNFPLVLSKRMPVSPERKCMDNLVKDVQLSPDITLGKTKQTPPRMTPSSSMDFEWQKYLTETKSKGAPHRLFRQPAMPPENPFRPSMFLESIDPQHQSLICVCSVVETQGYRVRLRFEGFSEAYDYWVNADSLDIFPPGWCEENNLELQPPPGAPEPFNWHQYIVDKRVTVAPRHIFSVTKEDFTMDSGVKPGMKMEAVDIRNQNLVCVATVAKVMGERILVHFDSWDSLYDYWTDLTSPYIHPVGWCEKNNVKLTPPNYCKPDFTWEKYLRDTNTIAMPSRLFRPLPPVGFRKGFKVECVDKRNPFLIRVATISEVDQHNLVIHFDNWPTIYDFKVYELSSDIHPVGWCNHTGHPLQPPPPIDGSWKGPCTVVGCLGLGHIRGPKFLTHNSEKNCPYALHNYKKDWILADRITILERNYGQGHNDNSSSVESAPKTVEQMVPTPSSSKKEVKPSQLAALKPSGQPKSATIKRKRSSASSSKDVLQKRSKVVSVIPAPRTPSPSLPLLVPASVHEPAKYHLATNAGTISNSFSYSDPEQVEVKLSNRQSKVQPIPGPSTSHPGQPPCSSNSYISPSLCSQSLNKVVVHNSEVKQRFSLPSTPIANFPIGAPVENEGIRSRNFDSHVVPLKTVVGNLHEATVSSWRVEELAHFISTTPGCEHTANRFLDQLIDGESFMMLSQNDFINVMGLKLGPAIKLSSVIRMISENSGYKSN